MPASHQTLNRAVRNRFYPRESHPFQRYSQKVGQFARTAQRILDVGCGHTAPDLEAIDTIARKVGVDVDPHLCRTAAPSVEFVRATSDRLPFAEEVFDLVICKSVLEHLTTPLASFQEFGRVLRRGGHLVLLTPNRWDYVSILSTLIPNRCHPWIVRVATGRPEEDTFPTWYRANTAGRIRQLAKATGLEISNLVHCREHPHYPVEELVVHLANLRGGHRFEIEDPAIEGGSERLAAACRRAYGPVDHEGYLRLGLPLGYGEGAAETIGLWLEGTLPVLFARRRRDPFDFGFGDVERACVEWLSLLRHVRGAPDCGDERWLALREAAAAELKRHGRRSPLARLPELPATTLQKPPRNRISLACL